MTTQILTRNIVDSKAVLARLMATENITVEHVPSAQTAYFDTESRRLVFPCWKGMSSDLYDMLAGHETGHALFTPAGVQPLMDAIRKVDTRNASSAAKTFLNIVEDARIERLMKARLPGLRRSFFNAYKELMAHPLFADLFSKVGEMRLIDRVNIHYKWGAWCKVPFTAEELTVVQAVETTKTFDDVVEVARRIWEMQRQQENEEPQTNEEQSEQGQPGQPGQDGEQQENPQGSSSTRDPQENTETENGESQQDNGDAKGEEKTEPSSKSKQRESAKGDGKESASGSETSDAEGQQDTTSDEKEPTAAQTDNLMQTASNGYRDERATYYLPVTVPAFDTKIGVIDFRTQVLPILEKFNTLCGGAAHLSKWETTSRRDVSIMQQEFLRRMAADASSRTSVAETGTIDVNRLWSYKISDDIFLQNATVRNGQSHGIVIFVDFSGSMSAIMPETIRQMLMLASWCRRSNIPCDVYGFSDGVGSRWTGNTENGMVKSPWIFKDSDTNRADLDTCMRLVHCVSTKGLSERDWRITAGGLMAAFARNDYYVMSNAKGEWGSDDEYKKAVRLFSLNSTPTTAATAAALTIVEEFKRKNGLQIVHFVTLTDGEPSDRVYARGKPTGKMGPFGSEELHDPVTLKGNRDFQSGLELRDSVTGRGYRTNGGRGDVGALNRMLCDRVSGLNSVGISITAKRDFKNLLRYTSMKQEQQDKCLEQSKRDGFLTATGVHGHTVWFAVPNPKLDDVDPFDSIAYGMETKSTLTKAFAASLEKAGNNRLLCTRLVDLMAKPAQKVSR